MWHDQFTKYVLASEVVYVISNLIESGYSTDQKVHFMN